MADFYNLIESHEGEHVQLEVWGGRTRVRPGYHVGDLIELYSDDERDDARLHVRALNHDLSADLWLWLKHGPEVPSGAKGSGNGSA